MKSPQFYTITPRVQENLIKASLVVSGLERVCCPVCEKRHFELQEHLEMGLDFEDRTRWPDVLAGSQVPLFMVSDRVAESLGAISGVVSFGSISFVPDFVQSPFGYQWLRGDRMHGAKLDWAASGFEPLRCCEACGARLNQQVSRIFPTPLEVALETWTGADLFTTDLSQYSFFCTKKVIDLFSELRVPNLSVRPAWRSGSSFRESPSLDYLSGER